MSKAPRTYVRRASLMCFAPAVSQAHSFGTPYILPIPFWMYVYGCVGTLVVTFALTGIFVTAPADTQTTRTRPALTIMLDGAFSYFVTILRFGASGCLLLTILAGLIGSQDPTVNIGMTLFWVVFLLVLAYLTLLVGDLYALINPWKWAVAGLERLGLDLSHPRLTYSRHLGHWPAFAFYVALIWIELFVGPKPSFLSSTLLVYSVLTFIGAALFGKEAWFCNADVFSVFFVLIGKLAPVEYSRKGSRNGWQARLRPPFVGALNDRAEHLSTVVFVLFMLSSTTYDAIHDTVFWTGLFWKNALWLLQPLWGTDLSKAQNLLMGGYLTYRQAGLIVFPFLYFGLYVLVLAWVKVLIRFTTALRTLALAFCYSLIPIAIAYHFTHYLTFLVAEIANLPRRLSDPFGFGWDLLKSVSRSGPPILKMAVVWHAQLAALLIGHVVSVYLAHRVALQTFPTRRQVLVSQAPLLLLMIVYTIVGLWILSLPLGSSNG